MRNTFIGLVLLACACGGGNAQTQPTTVTSATSPFDAVLAGPQRTDGERARDTYRHPRATLEFFGLTGSMTVIELAPGQGWYTAILAPILHDKGKLFVTMPLPDASPEAQTNAKALTDRFAKMPAVFGNVATVTPDVKGDYSLGADGSADMVVTFRNIHGWARDGVLGKVFGGAFRVLKKGGVLGVEEHRAKEGGASDPETIGKTGYVPEAVVIEAAKKAGFELAQKSEVNANPKDTKDHPQGVWSLPPTYREGDKDHAKYAEIGESDRMTLKFIKP